MLKTLEEGVGYVYYVAVAKAQRNRGIGKLLLDDALQRFKAAGLKEVFASVEDDNEPSEALFASEGFTRTSFGEISRKNGNLLPRTCTGKCSSSQERSCCEKRSPNV